MFRLNKSINLIKGHLASLQSCEGSLNTCDCGSWRIRRAKVDWSLIRVERKTGLRRNSSNQIWGQIDRTRFVGTRFSADGSEVAFGGRVLVVGHLWRDSGHLWKINVLILFSLLFCRRWSILWSVWNNWLSILNKMFSLLLRKVLKTWIKY